jgi:hypothetical protein
VRTFIATSLLLAGIALAGEEPVATVKAGRISEYRASELATSPVPTPLQTSGVTLTLYVEGEAFKSASRYGNWKIAEAVNDTGTTMKVRVEAANTPAFVEEQQEKKKEINAFELKALREKGAKFVPLDLELSLPARKATKIARIKGTVDVTCGETKIVKVEKLTSLTGKKVEDPVLKAAGLELEILGPIEDVENSFAVEYGGNLEARVDDHSEPEIADKDGKSVLQGTDAVTFGGKHKRQYALKQKLDDTLVLQCRVITNQKTVTVPFELKDVELP